MLILYLFISITIIQGGSNNIVSDVIKEKIYTQIFGIVNYVMDSEDIKPIEEDVTFNLYTRKNPNKAEIIFLQSETLFFNPKSKTYFIAHGYTDHKNRNIIIKLREVLTEDCNVFVIDWQRLAGLIYFNAANSTYAVGQYLGKFLLSLENKGLNLNNVHIIGHSLGAHIAGIAGRVTNGKIGRITGLDPAGPLFEFMQTDNNYECLDKSNSKFVDIIHTNGGQFGIINPVGHADFYPNEGISPQPGCESNIIILTSSCSHVRSVIYYTESINGSIPFEARHCKIKDDINCLGEKPVHMGHHLEIT